MLYVDNVMNRCYHRQFIITFFFSLWTEWKNILSDHKLYPIWKILSSYLFEHEILFTVILNSFAELGFLLKYLL